MSTTIDQKVVEMRFDNQRFEKNISTTIGSLEKLKNSLHFTGATKGLENVGSAVNNIDFKKFENTACEAGFRIQDVFIKLSNVLEYQIARKLIDMGSNIAKALTITPITTGFSEYELKMGSIQTMMAATGESLETVNGYLNELNEYSDKTIYSFSDMTQNIGKFTNAGVSLEDSVAAIQGIANVAAVSGANSNEASRAMYNFAQALSSGYVKLIDWKSIELANMGTVEFKEQLLEAAAAAGTLTKTGDGMYKTMDGKVVSATKNFNDSLQDQWMTSEVLIGTLKKYTDTSTEIGKKATQAATEVKTLSQLYDTLKESAQSGWAQTWEIIVGDFDEAKKFMTELSDVFGTLIGNQAKSRNELLENWKVLGGRTALLDSIRNLFEAIGSVVTPVKEAFRDIFPPMTAERLLGFTEGLKNLTERMILSDDTADKVKRTFKGLFAILDIVKTIFGAMFNAVGSLLGPMGDLGGGVLDITAGFGDWLVTLSESIKSSGIFTKVFTGVADVIKAVMKGISGVIGFVKNNIAAPGLEGLRKLLDGLKDSMSGVGNFAEVMKNMVVSAFEALGSFLEGCSLIKLLQGVWNIIKVIATGVAKVFGAVIGGVADVFAGADFNRISGIINSFISGGILVGIVKFIKNLSAPLESFKGLGDVFNNISGILDGVRGCLEAYQSKLKADALIRIAAAVGILAAALVVLACIDSDKLFDAVSAMGLLLTGLMVGLSSLSKMNTGIIDTAKLLILGRVLQSLATALLILAVAMAIIGTMSIEELGVGLTGIAAGLGMLVIAVNLLPESKVSKAAAAIKKMSTALLILSVALKIMGTMTWQEMAVGLTTTVVSLAALVGAVILLPEKQVAKAATAIKKMATALLILSVALKIMGTMTWGEVAVGLTTMVVGLAALVAAANLLPKDMALRSLGINALAIALVILAGALKIMASMSWDDIARGLVVLGGSLAILAIGLHAMNGTLAGSAALLIASAALLVLAPVLLMLGAMSWESIAKGLVTIAGAFTIIGVAGLVLAPIIPAILALGGALALIGVGILAAGTGLLAFGTGLTALSVGFTALVASLGAITTGIIGIITAIAVGLGEGIIAICTIIAGSASSICAAITTVLLALIEALKACIPPLMECLGLVLDSAIAFILEYVPKLVDAGIKLIISLLEGIASRVSEVIDAAVSIITAFIEGIGSGTLKVVNAGVKMIIDFINGLANSIRENTPKMIEAVNNLMDAVMDAIKAWFKNAFSLGGELIGNVKEGVTGGISGMVQAGKDAIAGFIKGIGDKVSAAAEAAKNAGKKALEALKNALGINSPSKEFAEAGMDSDRGFIIGLESMANKVAKSAASVGTGALDGMRDSLSGVASIMDGDIDMEPTIRPVLDLSRVESGVRTLSGMLNIGSSVGVLANVGAISAGMSRRNQNGNLNEVTKAIDKLGDKLEENSGNTYIIDGVTYDDGSNVASAVEEIIHVAKVERRK